ncbi:MAG: hypothetical protein Q8O72_05730 [Bacteroidales bacterium]|nr:hypothetical protein [Bacteroidales bacterium]
MKKSFCISMLLLLSVSWFSQLNAQDLIYLRDHSARIAAKNVEISRLETKYQLYDGNTGVVFALNNSDISMIAFEDGTVRFFENEEKLQTVYDFKKNLFTFHLFDLIVNEFTISYEHIFNSGKIGLQIPVSLGFSNANDNNNNNGFDDIDNKFYSGINLNFYPTGQGKVRYFLGPAIQVGTGNYNVNTYYGSYSSTNEETFFFRFFVNNGLVISPVKDMSLTAVGSIGIRYLGNPDENHDEIKTVGAFAFNLSYRF